MMPERFFMCAGPRGSDKHLFPTRNHHVRVGPALPTLAQLDPTLRLSFAPRIESTIAVYTEFGVQRGTKENPAKHGRLPVCGCLVKSWHHTSEIPIVPLIERERLDGDLVRVEHPLGHADHGSLVAKLFRPLQNLTLHETQVISLTGVAQKRLEGLSFSSL